MAVVREPPSSAELSGIAVRLAGDRLGLTIEDVRTLYLFGPAFVTVEDADGNEFVVKVRSSLEAALGDVRPVVGRDESGRTASYERSRLWLAAAGYLMLVDQLSTVLEGGMERLLMSFGGLDAKQAGAIGGLRNAFLHTYGLVNDPSPKRVNEERRKLLRHVFRLQVGSTDLVLLGDRSRVLTASLLELPHTLVDIGLLGDLVERMVATIRARHLDRRRLNWQIHDIDEFVARFLFTHLDPIEQQR